MTDRDSNLTHHPEPPTPESAAKAAVAGGMSPARRRFLTRGLVGGPVALYVAGRPVHSLAWNEACTWSAYTSAMVGTSLSHVGCWNHGYKPTHYNPNGSTTPSSVGWPSGYTTGKYYASPSPHYSSSGMQIGTTFGSVFPTSPDGSLLISNILLNQSPADDAMFIAAVFNALNNLIAEDAATFISYLTNTLYPYFLANPSQQASIRLWFAYLQPNA
jgi:hypothetical protein